ncbi:Histone-lysine N-methyltransferase [Actinidia chinensis var. chinensis]|uniref:Histone-lysine N-methyltransferase n=1 Tax=Actinidia chinensis var. chinensis TaxID=1590841 RepID=A0A2R6PC74_ACTCC|nr:Histone-lysine N-methyltransferase [Actinidia chinensis var. chinensis]
MAKPEEDKSDGLEIISIGTLYGGPWGKKYWSSSRGKYRYPYAVGYKAVRTHNGITYRMEIHEGLKGPLFSIASTDGQPCSGQTPDIARENFQKKGCSRVKLWHGKRFSCNIDGVEFFGFKNPFVQRLLRELVANVSRTAEHSFLPSRFGNGDSGAKHNSQCKESSSTPDLLPQIKGKRRRKGKTMNSNSTCGAVLKKLRPKDEMHSNDTVHSRQGGGTLAASINLETAVNIENNPDLVKDGFPLESSRCTDHLKEVSPQKEINGGRFENCISTGLAGYLSMQNQLLDRSTEAEIKMLSSSLMSVDKDEQVPFSKDAQIIDDKDLCAPDSLDFLHDGTSDAQQNGPKESPCKGKSELNAGESLPLLKTFTRKKNTMIYPSETSPCWEQKLKENYRTDHHAEVASHAEVHTQNSLLDHQEKEKMHILNTDPGSLCFGQNGPVVPDSFKNDQSGSDVTEAVLGDMGQSISTSETLGLPVGIHAMHQSSNCHAGNSDSKFICSYNKGPVTSIVGSNKDDIFISESALGCIPYRENVFLARNKYMCQYSDEKDMRFEIHSKENDCYTSPDCTEGTTYGNSPSMVRSVQLSHQETSVDKVEAGTGNTSFTKFQNETNSTRKHNCPLTESIIFRSFNDGYAHDMSPAENFLLSPEIQPGILSSGVDARLERRPYSIQLQKNANNSNGVFHNRAPVLQKNQEFIDPSNFDNKLDFLDQSASSVENSHVQVDKELHGHQNRVNITNSISQFLKQGTGFSVNNSKVADGLNLKPQMNMGIMTDQRELFSFGDAIRTLFMYEVALEEKRVGFPSSIGQTPILLPTSRDAFGREIALKRSGLQFTPDGLSLVLLKSMKAPYCRERKMQCQCSACRSDCFENNALNVVQVKHGYVSVVVNFKTVDNVHCILVCEPNYLVCVEESGTLHLWVMNSTWSAHLEECDVSTSDCIFPCIVELKRIPNCSALVVVHNGFGEFGLWDISKRSFVARFSSPSTSVLQFLPISLFIRQSKGSEDHINVIMAATKTSFLEQGENHVSIPMEGEDVAIWLFISTFYNSNILLDFQSTNSKLNPVGFWRLALLVKNRVILGSALDARAAAVGALAGHGIMGTGEGLVHIWDLAAGTRFRDLQCFKGMLQVVSTSSALVFACYVQTSSQLIFTAKMDIFHSL